MLNRCSVRRLINNELHRVRGYRDLISSSAVGSISVEPTSIETARSWVQVADMMVASLKAEDEEKARFAVMLFGLESVPVGNVRRVMSVASAKFNRSIDGLYVWRSDALYLASIYAAQLGLI